ncbi:MAG: hypothetical protein AAGG01_22045 [Planctomycetota bacterium]
MSPARSERWSRWWDLQGTELLDLDYESKAMVPFDGEERIEGASYCDGWHDHAGMGISLCAVWDLQASCTRVFTDDNASELRELAHRRDGLITWNGERLDLPLIAECWGLRPQRSGSVVPLPDGHRRSEAAAEAKRRQTKP